MPPARGKILKVGASSSPSFAVEAGDSSGRADEPPLEVLPISVWSPTSWGTAPPPAMQDEVTGNRDRFEAAGDEYSLLSHAELASRAVSSILCDSDLRRVGALPVKSYHDNFYNFCNPINKFTNKIIMINKFINISFYY